MNITCPGCGASLNDDGVSSSMKCPFCQQEFSIVSEDENAASAGGSVPLAKVPLSQQPTQRSYDIVFSTTEVWNETLTQKPRYGTLMVKPEGLVIIGHHGVNDGTQTAGLLGGAIGALIAGAINASRKKKELDTWEVTPQNTRVHYDNKRRQVSIQLPSGLWCGASLKGGLRRASQQAFDEFSGDLKKIFADNMQPGELGRWDAKTRKARKVALWVLLGIAVFISAMALLVIIFGD